jgi:DNA-binding CsgD family transcriptional regulator
MGELQLVAAVAAAEAEAAWLTGRPEEIAGLTEAASELARREGAPWYAGELACWRARGGVVEPAPESVAEPYGLERAGDVESLRASLAELQRIGARPAATIVARRLRESGATGLPRGPRQATQQNPSGLTSREAEVLELVAQGFSDADIASRLFLSKRTVHHHVSAILRKLNVSTRAQAAAQIR